MLTPPSCNSFNFSSIDAQVKSKSGRKAVSVTNEKLYKDGELSDDGLYNIAATVTAVVKNSGEVAGAEVAQVRSPPSLRLGPPQTDTNAPLALPHFPRFDSQQDARPQPSRFLETFLTTGRVEEGLVRTPQQGYRRLGCRQARVDDSSRSIRGFRWKLVPQTSSQGLFHYVESSLLSLSFSSVSPRLTFGSSSVPIPRNSSFATLVKISYYLSPLLSI